MLVLSRRLGEEIVIDGAIRVKVMAVDKRCVSLGIVAPQAIVVDRAEVALRKAAELQGAKSGEPYRTGS